MEDDFIDRYDDWPMWTICERYGHDWEVDGDGRGYCLDCGIEDYA